MSRPVCLRKYIVLIYLVLLFLSRECGVISFSMINVSRTVSRTNILLCNQAIYLEKDRNDRVKRTHTFIANTKKRLFCTKHMERGGEGAVIFL